jgi:hypothetical protein
MNQSLSRIRNLYKYEDGDQIEARMGVQIDAGYGLTQYWDEQQGRVVNTDFTQHSPVLYPYPYSSKRGQYVVPATQGQQWYYNNPESETAGILDESGNVKSAYASLFEKTTITVGGATYPALRIKGNLCSANDLSDKHIYYKSVYNGKPFTCSQLIPVQTTVGDAKEILISITTADGSGSTALTNTNGWTQLTAALQRAGSTIAGATYQWQKLVNGAWVNVTNNPTVIEVSNATPHIIKVYANGVDSEDIFRVAVTHEGVTSYKTQQLTDTSDIFYIFEGCSQAGDAVEEGVNVSFNPVVYDRRTNVPDTSNTWSFSFLLLNLITGAQVGNPSTTVPFVVQYSTLEQEEGVSVVISASNE